MRVAYEILNADTSARPWEVFCGAAQSHYSDKCWHALLELAKPEHKHLASLIDQLEVRVPSDVPANWLLGMYQYRPAAWRPPAPVMAHIDDDNFDDAHAEWEKYEWSVARGDIRDPWEDSAQGFIDYFGYKYGNPQWDLPPVKEQVHDTSDDPAAMFVLTSTDGIVFRAHSEALCAASAFIRNMVGAVLKADGSQVEIPIALPASAEAIKIYLAFAYSSDPMAHSYEFLQSLRLRLSTLPTDLLGLVRYMQSDWLENVIEPNEVVRHP
ncbi:hypothetical protein Q5752_006482 [Cryptotrichosporon argae]